MRSTILNNIKEGLAKEIGIESNVYDNLHIEDIQTRLVDTITTNTFIGITINDVNPINREIGTNYPSAHDYMCSVALLIKNANNEEGQGELDKIVRRIIKYFAKDIGELNGLSLTEDGVTESVISYNINEINYTSGELTQGALGHIAVFNLIIRTTLTIN